MSLLYLYSKTINQQGKELLNLEIKSYPLVKKKCTLQLKVTTPAPNLFGIYL